MAAPAPAPLANRDGTIGDPDRTALQLWARSQGLPPADIERIVAAYDRSKAPRSPDWQLEIQQTAQELQRQGMDPRTVDAVVRLMGQTRDPKNAPLAELPNRAAEGAARDIMGPAPGRSKQLAGRDPGFMRDQRAETLDYRQPDLDRPRPAAKASQPTAVPPMLDRSPRAPFMVRKPDGSFELDPTYGRESPSTFVGPSPDAAPPVRTGLPRRFGVTEQGVDDRRRALYGQLDQLIQGRALPAPDTVSLALYPSGAARAAMGDGYVLEQVIPALRDRYSDRPDVLARLDAIERSMSPDPVGALFMSAEPPTEWSDPIDHTGRPRPPQPPPPPPRPAPAPEQGPRLPPGWYTGPDGQPLSPAEVDRQAIEEGRVPRAERAPAEPERQRRGGTADPDFYGKEQDPYKAHAGNSAPRVSDPRSREYRTNTVRSPEQAMKDYQIEKGAYDRSRAMLEAPPVEASPAGRSLQQAMEAPPISKAGAPPRTPSASSSMARELVGPPPSARGGGAAGSKPPAGGAAGGVLAGLEFAEVMQSRYGTNPKALTDEQLRELLLIARGQYPAGGMTATR